MESSGTYESELVMTCEFCGSTNITMGDNPSITQYGLDDKEYANEYKCMDCGAWCREAQRWRKKP